LFYLPQGAALKDLFKAVMTASEEVVTSKIQNLVTRLTGARETNTEIDRLAIRLERQYPGDVGVLCAYLLNYVRVGACPNPATVWTYKTDTFPSQSQVVLQPGQCIYLAANEPHAYLKGECVECMATSDNVVRAGLTPKLRDTEILCDMLTYKTGASVVLDGEVVTCESSRKSVVKQYHVPFDEFQLETYVVPSGETCAVETSRGPCVLLVTKGKGDINGEQIQRGAVVFAKAGEEIVLHATEDVFAYRAMINKRVF
jgi:mannose-6-phosphate isomerase